MKALRNIIKKGVSKRHQGKVLTLVYALLAATAFVISLASNSESSRNRNFDYMDLKSRIEHNFIISNPLNPNLSANNIISLFGKVNVISPQSHNEIVLEIKQGDTFAGLMTEGIGISYSEANKIVAALKGVYNTGAMKVNQKIIVTKTENIEDKSVAVKSIVIRMDVDRRAVVERDEQGNYSAKVEKDELVQEVNTKTGTIEGNLSSSMGNAGVPKTVANEFASVFSFSIDFRKDVHPGDKFEVIYEDYINSDGAVIKVGHILYAALKLRKETAALYRFTTAKGDVDYFNEKGLPMKRTLNRKPLAYINARISSPFGKRYHPILHQTIIHWGVDYAAPKGSAIFAAGDGVVEMAQWHGSYGNYIKIRHNSEYSTAYGHLNGFAKGIHAGTRVKQGQIIAYVGTTGRSTGPHLHYEVLQRGRRVNPLSIRASTAENLNNKDMVKFKEQMAAIQAAHPSLFISEQKVATNAGQK